MENRAFYPEKMPLPLGLYAHGVEVPEDAKLTFVAGQIGMDFEGHAERISRAKRATHGITASQS